MGSTTTDYVQDTAAPLPTVLVEQSGSQATYYLYGLDPSAGSGQALIGQQQTAWQYYHYDGLGSVRNLTDGSGQEVAQYDYYAFGELRAASGSASGNEWRFTGEQWDAGAGLYFLRARYYEPGVGRFVSADPFWGYAQLPQTQHQYVYVANNPVNWVDPSGLVCVKPTQCAKFANMVEDIIAKSPTPKAAIDKLYQDIAIPPSRELFPPSKDPCYGFKPAFYGNTHHYVFFLALTFKTNPPFAWFVSAGLEIGTTLQAYWPGIQYDPVKGKIVVDRSRVNWGLVNDSAYDFWEVGPKGIEHGFLISLDRDSFRMLNLLPQWIRLEICDRLLCMYECCDDPGGL